MYAIALAFREWDVEGEGGFLSRITYDQLFTWIEYNNLDPFTSQREDWRHAQTTAAVYNVNIADKSERFTPKDFMMESADERISREAEELKQRELLDNDKSAAAAHWEMYMRHLTAGAKPVTDGVYKVD